MKNLSPAVSAKHAPVAMGHRAKPVNSRTKPVAVPTPVILDYGFTPAAVHAKRAYKREEITIYAISDLTQVLGDYSYYSVIEPKANRYSWFGINENVFFNREDADNYLTKLKGQFPEKHFGILNGYFSLDVDYQKDRVHYYDHVALENINNSYEREWLRQTREHFEETAKRFAPADKLFAQKDFPDQESDQHTKLDPYYWRHYSVGAKHHVVFPFGMGSAPFFSLEEAKAYKKQLEAKYPQCEFYGFCGHLDSDLFADKKLEDISNPYEREWVRKYREHLAQHAKQVH